MKTQKRHMSDLHFENSIWKNRLDFYEDELKIFNHRLEEVAKANTGVDVKIKVEQFQNRFYINKVELLRLNKQIREQELELANHAIGNPTASDHMLFDDHEELRFKIGKAEQIYQELKDEFLRFLSDSL